LVSSIEDRPLLERALEAADHLKPARVVLDFRELSFVDSTGVHAVVRAHAPPRTEASWS
jgi:anti-anti-sigma regulatory factor